MGFVGDGVRSCLLREVTGTWLHIVVAHGEGRAEFRDDAQLRSVRPLVAQPGRWHLVHAHHDFWTSGAGVKPHRVVREKWRGAGGLTPPPHSDGKTRVPGCSLPD